MVLPLPRSSRWWEGEPARFFRCDSDDFVSSLGQFDQLFQSLIFLLCEVVFFWEAFGVALLSLLLLGLVHENSNSSAAMWISTWLGAKGRNCDSPLGREISRSHVVILI